MKGFRTSLCVLGEKSHPHEDQRTPQFSLNAISGIIDEVDIAFVVVMVGVFDFMRFALPLKGHINEILIT